MHSGHRQRMRDRIRENGMESLSDHEFLEYLLYFAQPRVNTNEQAHRLLMHFGSISKVLESDEKSLTEIEGIGPAAARFLSGIPWICRRYFLDKYTQKGAFLSISDIIEFLRSYYIGIVDEAAALMMLDADMSLISAKTIAHGNSSEVRVHIKKVIYEVIQNHATYVVLAHNHPSNKATPSGEDLRLTTHFSEVLRNINVQLIDHVIICPNGNYYSFAREHLV